MHLVSGLGVSAPALQTQSYATFHAGAEMTMLIFSNLFFSKGNSNFSKCVDESSKMRCKSIFYPSYYPYEEKVSKEFSKLYM